MSVYAPTPAFAERRPHPRTLALIIAGHAAVIAAVMAVKMDLPQRILNRPIVVTLIPNPEPPPPPPPMQAEQKPAPQPLPHQPTHLVQLPIPTDDPIQTTEVLTPFPLPQYPLVAPTASGAQPLPEPVRTGPRFATPASELRPPYPESKRRLAEEAVLKLRLSIDERGRVTAVDPVGRADPDFLQSARRHIIAHWRYKPAMEGERAVASSTVITLRFELDD
jgi:protein TonB